MNQYVVITERQGELVKGNGKVSAPVEQIHTRYIANNFHEVYDKALENLNDDELVTIHLEHVGVFMIGD